MFTLENVTLVVLAIIICVVIHIEIQLAKYRKENLKKNTKTTPSKPHNSMECHGKYVSCLAKCINCRSRYTCKEAS